MTDDNTRQHDWGHCDECDAAMDAMTSGATWIVDGVRVRVCVRCFTWWVLDSRVALPSPPRAWVARARRRARAA